MGTCTTYRQVGRLLAQGGVGGFPQVGVGQADLILFSCTRTAVSRIKARTAGSTHWRAY